MGVVADRIVFEWPGGSQAVPTCASIDLLTTALNAGIPIPHSCRRSDCLKCSAFVIASEDAALRPGSRIDLCQTVTAYSGVFELVSNPFDANEAAKFYPAKVEELTEVARDTVLLRLRTPRNQAIAFEGGQYASIILGSGLARSYSIASIEVERRLIDFYIRLVPGGQFSDWLSSRASVGEMLRLRAPLGGFHFRSQPAEKTVFIATGTGIVPIYAILNSLKAAEVLNSGAAQLIWGNRTRSDLFLEAEIDAICDQLCISPIKVFSRDGSLNPSRVTDVLREMDLNSAAIYAAGNPSMVRDIGKLCQLKGVNPRFVHSDAFTFDQAFVGGLA